MQYIRIDEYFAASHITGPRQNLLQVRLATGAQWQPVCERLPSSGHCTHDALDEAEIVKRVLEGVAEANRRCGTNFSVTHIRYVENDTGPEIVFGYLAGKIIEHLSSGGQFIVQAASPQVHNAL